MSQEPTASPPDDPPVQDTLAWGRLVLDHAAREVSVDGLPLALTLREYELVRFLMMNPSRVYTRQALLAVLWNGRRDVGTRAVDGHVGRLRAKLGPELRDCIRTVRGVGYSLSGLGSARRG